MGILMGAFLLLGVVMLIFKFVSGMVEFVSSFFLEALIAGMVIGFITSLFFYLNKREQDRSMAFVKQSDKNLSYGKPMHELNAVEFDLNNLNLVNLAQELNETINSQRWVIFKGWNVSRVKMDVERQEWIKEHIDKLGETSKSLAQTKANLFLHNKMVEDLIQKYYAEAEIKAKEFEANLRELDARIEEAEKRRQRAKTDIQLMSLEYLEKQTEIERNQIENDIRAAKKKDMDAYRNLINKAVEFYKDMPDHLKSLVTASIQNPNQTITENSLMMDDIKEFIYAERKAEMDQKAAEARKSHAEARREEVTSNYTEDKYDRVRNPKK